METNSFKLDTMVVCELDVDILAGSPFMIHNDIAVCHAHHEILIGGSTVIHYGKLSCHKSQPMIYQSQAFQDTLLFTLAIMSNSKHHTNLDSMWALTH